MAGLSDVLPHYDAKKRLAGETGMALRATRDYENG
jgi:hypothetical protein